tara:strand:- start:10339 stop:11055 length:717 start_codon:yes stop_codon:yes gene_type:complete
MLINDIHIFIKFLKNQGQNKYHSPEQIDDAFNRASLDLFRQEEKVFEIEQIITDTLRPFKERVVLSGGSPFTLPTGYRRATNVSFNYSNEKTTSETDIFEYCDTSLSADMGEDAVSGYEKEIDILPDGDWVKRTGNLIVGPTSSSPIARVYGNNLEVLPNKEDITLYYLRQPIKSKWAYTYAGDGRTPLFDEGNSVDTDWTETSHNELIEKTLGFLGIAVRDQTLIQFEQSQKNNNNE